MRILVVGARGGLGQDIVAEAVARGHETDALIRDSPRVAFSEAVQVVWGDVLDLSSLAAAVGGRDAVICALGTPSPGSSSTLLGQGTRNLVAVMSREGVPRLACVTLLGAGSSRANASLFYRWVILRALAPMLPDKEAQEQAVRASDLEWVLVRPPRFVTRKPQGSIRVIREGERGRLGHVVRADLARFLVDCAAEGRYVREALAVGS
ncbi:MAG: NAD(P)-dependent oxidoreductase [Candidatus Dormibacter sp.]|uniref:NAD(P)-dependent oxidoreductase n=1 Tax=Candidatus Dormibacter sp. TaxID=2973982 RepID=UPI000DB3078B|nr:MAG: flavin reductase [Candidatus Dormibacteraeota bacterium]